MLSGFSVRHKIVVGGHRQIVAIHMKGQMVDLQNSFLGVADHSVQMLTPGKVAMIRREEIIRIATERPAVGMAMWADTLVDASIFREWNRQRWAQGCANPRGTRALRVRAKVEAR